MENAVISVLLLTTGALLPCAIHVSRKLGVFDEVSFVDGLLHGFSAGEVVICESARGQEVTSPYIHIKQNLWESKTAV